MMEATTVADWLGFAMLVVGAVAVVLYIDRLRARAEVAESRVRAWMAVAEERRRGWVAAMGTTDDALRLAGMRGRGPKPAKPASPKRPAEPREPGLEANVLRDIREALEEADDEGS